MKTFKTLFAFLAFALVSSGCGSSSSPAPFGTATNSPPAPADSALIASVPDDCLIETYVGPFRGYELPFVKNGTWSDRFDYTSGLGDEIVSGYAMHRSSGQVAPNSACEELARVLMAAPVTDSSAEKRTYAVAFAIDATTTAFPMTLQEARKVDSLPANVSAGLTISVLQPCTQPGSTQCWEHLADQTLAADFFCSTSKAIERGVPAGKLTDNDDEFDFRKAYHLPFPDGCAFRIVNAAFTLADGRTIRASIAGTASTEASGPRLRVLRISPRQ